MEVTLIGMGPGDPSALTGGALAALEQADVLIGSRRLVERCALSPEAQRFSSTKSAEIVEILASGPWECPCVLYSGDTGFHSGTRTLLPLLEERGISWRVLPGVSSMQYFAAMLGRPWQEWQVVSAHGLACDPVGEVLSAKGRPVFFLTGGAGGAAALCRRLDQAGLGSLTAAVGEALSYPEERITRAQVWELAEREFSTLSVLLVDGAAPVWPVCSQGIDDGAFLRGEVPMTKQEVRAAALAKLEVRDGAVYWDVGAGTGSVSVELALLAPKSRVYAVEYKGEACALIRANRERFGAYNLELAEGRAPAALADLPAPDGVFIGGSEGELIPILEAALSRNPAVRFCVTAIAVETLGVAVAAFTQLGMNPQITQITVARSRRAGERNLMLGQNPVWIVTGQKEALL